MSDLYAKPAFPFSTPKTAVDADVSKLLGLEPAPAPQERVSASELAAQLAGRLCHDFISPASAIVSGIDLLEDPSAADMRTDAMNLIEASAKKLVALLAFARVAFGASNTAETFDVRDLHRLTEGVYAHVRAELDWQVALPRSGRAPCLPAGWRQSPPCDRARTSSCPSKLRGCAPGCGPRCWRG